MELKELKCKNCGASIEIEKDATTATCKFCNTTFSVDSAENTGYEFEKGRIKAQKEEFNKLTNSVSSSAKNLITDDTKKTVGSIFKGFAIGYGIIAVAAIVIFIIVFAFIFIAIKNESNENSSNSTVNKVIEKAVDEHDVYDFNFDFENENGTKQLIFLKNVLDDVITSNKKNDRKITVIYNNIKTSDPEEIKNLKNSFTANKYELSFNYDEDGYIYEAIIEDYNGV